MTELEKIKLAKTYIDSLAQGVNPLDGGLIPPTDITNNVHITRCLFYVSDILSQVINNGGTQVRAARVTRGDKEPFNLSDEARKQLIPDGGTVTVSDITARLNSLIDENTTVKLKTTTIGAWLVSIEMLEIVCDERGKNVKRPTQSGKAIGIYTEDRMGQYGPYKTVCYSKEAQQFIFDNIDALVYQNTLRPHRENQGAPWDAVQDELLKDLYKNGATVKEIARSLSRSGDAIRARIEKLGL